MGDVAARAHEAQPETVPAATPAQGLGGMLGAPLTPAGVLALQRTAGNRVARGAVTRATSARILARKSIADECADMQIKLGEAKNLPHSAALRKEAIALAGKAHAAYRSSNNDDHLDGCKRVVRGLARAGGESARAALDFARSTADKDVAGAVLANVPLGKAAIGQQDLMVAIGRLVGVTIPAAGKSAGAWLDANTPKIGEALKQVDAAGWISAPASDSSVTQTSLHFASNLLRNYFNFDPNLPDIVPNKMGKVAGLQWNAGESKLEADCDVWAAYGMQLFKAMGWTPVGYMSIIPTDPDRAGHAMALLKRPTSNPGRFEYLLGSDWYLKTVTAARDEDAKKPLLDHGLEIYANPKPTSYVVYFLPCPPSGEYDKKILDPVNKGVPPWKPPSTGPTPAQPGATTAAASAPGSATPGSAPPGSAATGRPSRLRVDVQVVTTSSGPGDDEVYIEATGPGGVHRTSVTSMGNGDKHTFELPAKVAGDGTKPIIVKVYDEDWPSADDLIVNLRWDPPFARGVNKRSFEGADYRVTLKSS